MCPRSSSRSSRSLQQGASAGRTRLPRCLRHRSARPHCRRTWPRRESAKAPAEQKLREQNKLPAWLGRLATFRQGGLLAVISFDNDVDPSIAPLESSPEPSRSPREEDPSSVYTVRLRSVTPLTATPALSSRPPASGARRVALVALLGAAALGFYAGSVPYDAARRRQLLRGARGPPASRYNAWP